MFGIGWAELAVIVVVALLVLGPARLPEAARNLGLFYGRFSRAVQDARRALQINLSDIEKPSDKKTAPPGGDGSSTE